jgi:hypothetical protein
MYNRIEFSIGEIKDGEDVKIFVYIFGDNEKEPIMKVVFMQYKEYMKCKENDSYIAKYISKNLKLEKDVLK